MQKSVSPRRRKLRFVAVVTALVAGLGSAGAFFASVTPTVAAELANEPNAPIVAFMVPLTLLVLSLLFEATRHVWRGKLPAPAPVRRRRSVWTAGPHRD